MHSVEGRIVLVTGGAMGMGRLYAEHAVAEGAAAVVLWDIDADALHATRDALLARGGNVVASVVDVASPGAVAAAADALIATTGAPAIVVNNAGVVRSKPFWEHDPVRDTEFIVRINTLATYPLPGTESQSVVLEVRRAGQ